MSKIKSFLFLFLGCLFLTISNVYAKDIIKISSDTVVKQDYIDGGNKECTNIYVSNEIYDAVSEELSKKENLEKLGVSTNAAVNIIKTNVNKIIDFPKSEINSSNHIDNEEILVIPVSKQITNITYSESGSAVANITTMFPKIPIITVSSGVFFSENITYVSGTILNSEDGILKIYSDETNPSKFLSNIAFESGGAIYNLNLTTVTMIGSYSIFSSNTATNAGGAIYSIGIMEIKDNVEFSNNGYNNFYYYTEGSISSSSVKVSSINEVIDISSTNAKIIDGSNVLTGGAIYQNGKYMNIGSNITFENNGAYKGGAMYVVLSTVTISSNATFRNNFANYNGGAVYVFKSTFTVKDGVIFSSNTAENKGGAIYSFDTVLNLNAISKEIKFSSNSAIEGGAIYSVRGEINLNANGANIYFEKGNSILSTGTAVMNIETSSTNYVDFDADVNIYGGTINFNFGEVKVSSNCHNFETGTLNLSSGTFNLSNKDTEEKPINVKVDTFTSTEDVNLKIGITTEAVSSEYYGTVYDQFTINNSASGVINLTEINISSFSDSSEHGKFPLFKGGNLENLRIIVSTKSVYLGKTYAFFQSPTLGELDFSTITVLTNNSDFLTYIEEQNASSMDSNVSIQSGTVTSHLAIYGNSNELKITGGNVKISSSGALSLFDLTKFDTEINNENYLYAENVNFSSKNITNLSNTVIIDSSAITASSSSAETVRFNSYDSSFSGVSIINNSSVNITNTNKVDNANFSIKLKLSSVSFSSATTGVIYSDINIKIDSVTNSNVNNKIICSIDSATFKNNKSENGGSLYSGISSIDVNNSNSSSLVIEPSIEYKLGGDYIEFISNSATQNGGAICNDNTMSSEEIENFSKIKSSSFTSTISYLLGKDVVFSSNVATQNGGAIYNYVEKSSGNVVFDTDFSIGSKAEFKFNEAINGSGGAIYNYNGEITFDDGAIFTLNKTETALAKGGAIYNELGTINLTAKEEDIIFAGNVGIGGAIYNSSGTINFIVHSSRTICFNTESDTMVSTSSGTINFNKEIKSENAGTIEINSNMSQVAGKINIYSGTFIIGETGTLFGGKNVIEDATFDFSSKDKNIKNYDLSNFTINKNLNLLVDVDLENRQMDTIYSSSNSIGSGNIYIKEFNLINATSEKNVDILFTSSTVLKDKVSSVSKTSFTASSSEYFYDVSYDKNTGYFTFINRDVANPTTLEGTVAMLAGSLATQDNIVNQAFVSMNTSFTNRHDRRLDLIENSKNLYASAENFIFFNQSKIEGGLWLRPYAYQEKVTIAKYDVDNTIYGALAGLDLKLTDDKLLSFYIGYTGVNQSFENIKVDQNGYVFGATGMLVKEKFYLGLTANVGVSDTKAESAKGTDDFQINTYVIGLKGGYEFKKESLIFEPNLTVMYGFYGVENYKTKQGAKVAEDSINNFHIEPQIKFKLDLVDGWKPYALLGYIFNTGKTSTQVNGNNKKEESIGPYCEYGIGLEKNFIGTAWVGYVQVTGKAGGKQGVGVNFGVKYAF